MSARTNLKIIEFYSGIGGMHYAMKDVSEIDATVVAAVDINTVANQVYRHNFSTTSLWQREIASISLEKLQHLNADMYTMSPPCQPFTRLGRQGDIKDARTRSFLHIIDLLIRMENPPEYILLENVKGFETSTARDSFLHALRLRGYFFQEFLLTPLQFGIPNARRRYYIICRRNRQFSFFTSNEIMERMPFTDHIEKTKCISDFLEELNDDEVESHLLTEATLKRFAKVLDITTPDSQKSCCFTKAYFHYAEGTGSVLQVAKSVSVNDVYLRAEKLPVDQAYQLLKTLQLRYFTPREVANIHCFPAQFEFPTNITRKQCYRLLGNSLNVKVVTELFKLLVA